MTGYVVRRLVHSLVVAAVALVAIFFIGRFLGDPVDSVVSPLASQEVRERVRDELGFNDPISEQFLRFASNASRLDFGISPVRQESASGLVISRLPATAYLTIAILALSLPMAMALGIAAALKPGGVRDRLVNVFALSGISVVEFWVGLVLIRVIAIPIPWIPTGGYGGVDAVLLPAVTGAFRVTGRLAQFIRSALIEEYGKPYVETARAKGISERRVFLHVAKNAAIPVVTLSGDEMLNLAGGIVIIETVFGWPGIGRLIIQSLVARDLFVLEASVFILVIIVMGVNLVVDLTYAALNPKVRYE